MCVCVRRCRPCAATPWWSQRAKYVRISGDAHALLPEEWGLTRQMACGPNCMVQDLLAVDTTDLADGWVDRLVAMGAEDCAALRADGEAIERTPMEQQMPNAWRRQPPPTLVTDMPRAHCLPDGSWSCGRIVGVGVKRPPSCTLHTSEPPTCQSLWD